MYCRERGECQPCDLNFSSRLQFGSINLDILYFDLACLCLDFVKATLKKYTIKISLNCC